MFGIYTRNCARFLIGRLKVRGRSACAHKWKFIVRLIRGRPGLMSRGTRCMRRTELVERGSSFQQYYFKRRSDRFWFSALLIQAKVATITSHRCRSLFQRTFRGGAVHLKPPKFYEGRSMSINSSLSLSNSESSKKPIMPSLISSNW